MPERKLNQEERSIVSNMRNRRAGDRLNPTDLNEVWRYKIGYLAHEPHEYSFEKQVRWLKKQIRTSKDSEPQITLFDKHVMVNKPEYFAFAFKELAEEGFSMREYMAEYMINRPNIKYYDEKSQELIDLYSTLEANPALAWYTRRVFQSPEQLEYEINYLSGVSQMRGEPPEQAIKNLIRYGFMYNYLAINSRQRRNPQFTKAYVELLKPYIEETDPQYMRLIRELKESGDASALDTPRLSKLKGFWKSVFTTYWVSMARTQGEPTHPLNDDDVQEARSRLPTDMSQGMGRTAMNEQAASLNSLEMTKRKKSLEQELKGIFSQYADRDVSLDTLRSFFGQGINQRLFFVFNAGMERASKAKDPKDALSSLADQMTDIVTKGRSPESIQRALPADFSSLDPREKIGILLYGAFVSTGNITQDVRAVLHHIQKTFLPLLDKYHDNLPLSDDGTLDGDAQNQLTPDDYALNDSVYGDLASRDITGAHYGFVNGTQWEIYQRIESNLTERQRLLTVFRIMKERNFHFTTVAAQVFLTVLFGLMVSGLHAERPQTVLATTVGGLITGLANMWFIKMHSNYFQAKYALEKVRKFDILSDTTTRELDTIHTLAKTRKARSAMGMLSAVILAATLISSQVSFESLMDGFVPDSTADISSGSRPVDSEEMGDTTTGNMAEAPQVGTPELYVQGITEPTFISNTSCVQMANASDLSCFGGDLSFAELPRDMLSDVQAVSSTEMELRIQEEVAKGHAVMRKLDPKKGNFMGIPVGYRPLRALYTPVDGQSTVAAPQIEWSGLGGIYLTNFDAEKVQVALIFEKEVAPNVLAKNSTNIELMSLEAFPAAEFDTPEFQHVYQLIDWAKEVKGTIPTGDVIQTISRFIEDRNVDYGFVAYEQPATGKAIDSLKNLLRTDPTNPYEFANKEWICNQYRYAMLGILNAAGYDQVVGLSGSQYDPVTPLGGYGSQAHATIAYKENDTWYMVDVTGRNTDAEDLGYPEIPKEAPSFASAQEQKKSTRNDNVLALIGLSTALILGGAALSGRSGIRESLGNLRSLRSSENRSGGKNTPDQKSETPPKLETFDKKVSPEAAETALFAFELLAEYCTDENYLAGANFDEEFTDSLDRTTYAIAADTLRMLTNESSRADRQHEVNSLLLGYRKEIKSLKRASTKKTFTSQTEHRLHRYLTPERLPAVREALQRYMNQLEKLAQRKQDLTPEQRAKVTEIISTIKKIRG